MQKSFTSQTINGRLFSFAKWLLGFLGNLLRKEEKWEEATDAYAARQRRFWISAHRAGRKQEALDALLEWLTRVDLLQEFGGLLLRKTREATLHLDDVDLNNKFVCYLAERTSRDDVASRARLAVLSWLLGLPTQVGRFYESIDGSLLGGEIAALLQAFAFNRFDDSPRPSKAGSLALVCWNRNADGRPLQDLGRSFGRLMVVAPSAARDRLPPDLQSTVEFVSARSNIPVDGALDNVIAGQCAEVAEAAIAGLVQALGDSALGESARQFAPALQLSFEDRLYDFAIGAASHALLAEQLQPDACIAVTGENVPAEVYFPPTLAASVICAPRIFQHPLSSSVRAEEGEIERTRPDTRHTAQDLWAQLQKETQTLFATKSATVGILANFSPADFRMSPVAPAIVRAILRRQSCILLQRTNVKSESERSIRRFLGLDDVAGGASRCELWAGLEGIRHLANQTPYDWSSLCSAMMAGVESLQAAGQQPSHGSLSAGLIKSTAELFLAKNFRPLLLLGLSALKTFRGKRLTSLLSIHDDRHPVARVFTLAAQESGLPVYNYSYLFLSRYARYKKPLADYVFVPSTYHADFFQNHFGFSPNRLIRIGSHAIAARLLEARGLDPLACRQRIGQSSPRPLIVFFSQPRLFEKTSTAVSWLLEATAKIHAELAIRLHPGEKHLAAEYKLVIERHNASDRAWVDISEASVTEALLAADIVATMWSNVGLEAAALGRAVLAVKLEANPPIDLAGMGVAVGADSETSVWQAVRELLTDGPAGSQLGRSRQNFFKRNPELLTGEVEERIAETLCWQHS